jgi:hypothetical protein
LAGSALDSSLQSNTLHHSPLQHTAEPLPPGVVFDDDEHNENLDVGDHTCMFDHVAIV